MDRSHKFFSNIAVTQQIKLLKAYAFSQTSVIEVWPCLDSALLVLVEQINPSPYFILKFWCLSYQISFAEPQHIFRNNKSAHYALVGQGLLVQYTDLGHHAVRQNWKPRCCKEGFLAIQSYLRLTKC